MIQATYSMQEEYQVVFQAETTFQKVYVNIAIDDIKVSKASQCGSVSTSTTVLPPVTTAVASPYDCDFENGLCQWTIDKSTG